MNELLALVVFAVCAVSVVVGAIVMSLAIAQEMRTLLMIAANKDFKIFLLAIYIDKRRLISKPVISSKLEPLVRVGFVTETIPIRHR